MNLVQQQLHQLVSAATALYEQSHIGPYSHGEFIAFAERYAAAAKKVLPIKNGNYHPLEAVSRFLTRGEDDWKLGVNGAQVWLKMLEKRGLIPPKDHIGASSFDDLTQKPLGLSCEINTPVGLLDPLPLIISGYNNIEKLSSVTCNQVYRARRILDNSLKIIKVFNLAGTGPQCIADSILSFENNFNDKLFSIPSEYSAYLVTADDFGFTSQGDLYIAMDYIEGKTLEDDRRCWSMSDKFSMVDQLMKAVEGCNEYDLFHRDIKPTNVILLWSNDYIPQVRLIDFDFLTSSNFKGEKITSVLSGTHGYLPPEAYRGNLIDYNLFEVFSLGATIYFMLTGEKAFPKVSQYIEDCGYSQCREGVQDVFEDEYANLKYRKASSYGMSKQLYKTVINAVHPDRNKRFKNVSDFRYEMRKHLSFS